MSPSKHTRATRGGTSLPALAGLLVFAATAGCGTSPEAPGLAAPGAEAPGRKTPVDRKPWDSFDVESGWKSAQGPFEAGASLKVRSEGKAQASLRIVREGQTEGSGALEVSFAITGLASVDFFRRLTPPQDWSRVDGLEIDVVSRCTERLMISLFLEAGQDGSAQRSQVFSIVPHSTSTLSFDFHGRTFSSPETSGRRVADIRNAQNVSLIGFSITGLENPAGSVLFDNLRLISARGAPSARRAPESPATGSPAAGQAFAFSSIRAAARVPVFEKFEIDAELSLRAANPYDPAELTLDALFTSPSGKTSRVPAFWYVPFARDTSGSQESIRPEGDGWWKVRFAPSEEGKWSYKLVARKWRQPQSGSASPAPEQAVESDLRSFDTIAGSDRGYIHVSTRDRHYFEFQRGGTFFPIGSNVAWYDPRGISAYDLWFGKMGGAGANYARIWFASWGFAQEWSDTGLGDYSARQRQAWELDSVVDLAGKMGIYLMLCLLNHGAFSTGTNPEWQSNPYNRAAGGFLDTPAQFLSDPRAKKLFMQRMRYIVSRWGYSTHIFAWELWNEVNFADGVIGSPDWVPWLKETADGIRSLDLGRHMVSNSYSIPVSADDPSWQMMDFVQEHKYSLGDWAAYMKRETDKARSDADKPFFFGEYGISGDIPDKEGIILHDGMWGSFMAGAAAGGMLWWWDQYIEPNDLYGQFGTLSRFLAGEDLAGMNLAPAPMEKRTGVRIYRLSGPEESFVWIKDSHYSYQGFEDLAIREGLGNVVFPTLEGFTIDIPVGLKAGASAGGSGGDGGRAEDSASSKWSVQLWDPQTGRLVSEQTLTARDGALTLDVPAFSKDLACKIKAR